MALSQNSPPPRHIAIIMDGNGRWAKQRGLPRTAGHAAGAYFIGLKFGRHKLAPVVSPNKTIEGALGGIAFAVVSMLVYALIIDLLPGNLRVNYGLALLYGFAGSLLGIFGDLCFSIVKRQTGIKDYGNLIPGHGGVLDRFDSLTLVAPAMEVLLVLLPMAV